MSTMIKACQQLKHTLIQASHEPGLGLMNGVTWQIEDALDNVIIQKTTESVLTLSRLLQYQQKVLKGLHHLKPQIDSVIQQTEESTVTH